MKTSLLIASFLLTCFCSVASAQSLKTQAPDNSKPIEEQIVGVTPTKTKLKAGQVNTWRVDLTNSQSQFLHIRVKNRFQLASLLKVVTPFAVAKVISRNTSQTSSQSTESSTYDGGLPVNVAAGVVASAGALTGSRQRGKSQFVLTYYDQDGKVTGTTMHLIPNGREIVVPMNYCGGPKEARIGIVGPGKGSVEISMNSTPIASFSKRGGVIVNSEDNPCDPDEPGMGGENDEEPKLPSSLTNPQPGETYTDSYGTVMTWNSDIQAWTIGTEVNVHGVQPGQISIYSAAPVIVMTESGFIQEFTSVIMESLVGGATTIALLPILILSGDTNPHTSPGIPSPAQLPWEKGVSPGPDWTWKGNGSPESGQGNWVNDQTGQKLHPDFDHPEPKGPHWGLKQPDGSMLDLFPDGRVVPNPKGGTGSNQN